VSTSVGVVRTMGLGQTRTREAFARLQLALVLAALGLNLTWVPRVREPLPLPGSTSIFIPDVLLILAVVLWVASRLLLGSSAGTLPRTALLGPLLAVFGAALVPGIIRGHERYGASLVGQPLRLLLYAAIGLAMTELRPQQVYRAIVGLFYAGTALQAAFACWYLATGTSQSISHLLSTGGSRTLDIGTSIYLSGALFLVILNLELSFPLRRWVHLTVAALALFGIVLAYDRTTFIALVLLIPLGAWRARRLGLMLTRRRRFKLLAAAAGVLAIVGATLSFGSTFVDRVKANPLQDHNVRWRMATLHQALGGLRSGRWEQRSPFDQSRNQLANPEFEEGSRGWHIQGGRLVSIPSQDQSFGKRSLEIVTNGAAPDQGLFSAPVLTTRGQSWTFTIWLRGASGGERVNVSIWKYGRGGSALGQSNLPITLTTVPIQLLVTTAVTDPGTTSIRALVRTVDARAVKVIVDQASLTTLGHASALKGVPYLQVGGGVVEGPTDNGALRTPDGSLNRLNPRSYLANGEFEDGTTGWNVEGGRLTTIPSNNPDFGRRSLELTTNGILANEGVSSSELPVVPGQTWTFSMWLKGTRGGERMQLGIRQYDAAGNLTRQTSAPVTLSISPTEYFVTSTIAHPAAHIRVSVTTREGPRAIVIYGDAARVRRLVASTKDSTDASSQTRGSGLFLEEPLLGLGFGRSFDYIWEGAVYHFDGDPHDDFIWLLAGGGVLAFGAFVLLLGAFVRGSWRRIRGRSGYERALVVWALLTWFVFMLNSATEPILTEPGFLLTVWTLMLLPGLVARNGRPGDEDR
jgi:hypothetical protein